MTVFAPLFKGGIKDMFLYRPILSTKLLYQIFFFYIIGICFSFQMVRGRPFINIISN